MGIVPTEKQTNIIMEFWNLRQTSRIEAKKFVERILKEGIGYNQE